MTTPRPAVGGTGLALPRNLSLPVRGFVELAQVAATPRAARSCRT